MSQQESSCFFNAFMIKYRTHIDEGVRYRVQGVVFMNGVTQDVTVKSFDDVRVNYGYLFIKRLFDIVVSMIGIIFMIKIVMLFIKFFILIFMGRKIFLLPIKLSTFLI